jgi:hypothetical protein
MSSISTILGKAFEYACVLAIEEIVTSHRKIEVLNNSSLQIAKNRYENDISTEEQADMLSSAKSGINAIIEMEPKIIEDGNDILTLVLQADTSATKGGDIRDVLIIRRSLEWEIGISVKHNHAALKHSRLSIHIDFGNEWMKTPCSQNYFTEIRPIFNNLTTWRRQNLNWRDLPNKEDDVYIPLLDAFIKEFKSLQNTCNVTEKLIEYLIGSNGRDYYKLIHNNDHTTTIMPFNIFGTLNQSGVKTAPNIIIPKIEMPDRIIELAYKEKSKTTVILTMNKGWSISFRIHNASTKVEPSLKFDIQLQSKPEEIFYLSRKW